MTKSKKVVNNIVGVESEVHVFLQNDIKDNLRVKAACMLLAELGQLYGCKDNGQTKTCPYSGTPCGGHEYLPNGSRTYWDHGYLEYATPACATASEATAAVQAGDRMVQNAIAKLNQSFEKNIQISAVRNNIDHGGHSFGAHVNIRMTRKGYDRIFIDGGILNSYIVPFFVTLPVLCGSGRCSSEKGEDLFQIWQRCDFIKELVGLQTTYDRPLINTRDESLAADPQKYARFHIIAFDANRLETAEYIKLGLLRLLCAAIDADKIDVALELDDPITAIRSISREPFKVVRLASNKTITALEIQRTFLDAFTKLHERDVFAGRVPDAVEILTQWDYVLTKLEKNLFSLIGTVDWITKYAWLEQIRSNKGLKWSSPQIKWLDMQYHCLMGAPDIACRYITTDKYIDELTTNAPQNCRAAIRGELLRRFGNKIAEANWHYVVSSEDKIAYLLPDDPKPDLVKVLRRAKTLKEAATLLGLACVPLNRTDKLQKEQNESSKKEKQIATV